MQLSLAEIINKAIELKTKEDKVKWLKSNESVPLKRILAIMYDKDNYKLLIPHTKPPYTPSEYPDSQGVLFRESRKIVYFFENPNKGDIHTHRRQALFIQMLESVHKEDAELLCKMIAQKPLKGLTKATVNEAYPNLIKGKND